jgi:hypothetical protein
LQGYARKVHEAATKLADVLNQSSWEADIFRYGGISTAFPLTDFRIQLQRLPHFVEIFQTVYSSPTTRNAIQLSPTNWFFGICLPPIFEKHFREKATRSRHHKRGLESPFIRFATAVSTSRGMRVSAETVSAAMTKGAALFGRAGVRFGHSSPNKPLKGNKPKKPG